MALTDTDALTLARRVEATFGDDGGVFAPDGSERGPRNILGDNIRLYIAVDSWYKIARKGRLWGIPAFAGTDRWYKRDGQPWQADIEKYVAEWRADPRSFATYDALAMAVLWPKLIAMSRNVRLLSQTPFKGSEPMHWVYPGEDEIGPCDTIAEAVCRAWLAVTEKASAVD